MFLHALGDPTRRAIVERLERGADLGVAPGDTFEDYGGRCRATLADIEKSGLVRTTKVGRVRTCALNQRGFGCGGVDR